MRRGVIAPGAPKARPILYSGPMVRAILSGIKTQTRRVFKLPSGMRWYGGPGELGGEATGDVCDTSGNGWWSIDELACPYGDVGDRLWVRESLREEFTSVDDDTPNGCLALYAADSSVVHRESRPACYEWERPTLPSIHMPRWASRITLEITEVRAQRIQEISEADILAEGIGDYAADHGISKFGLVAQWVHLWEAINGEREGGRYAWDNNPWTWALTFRRLPEHEGR